jgi:hypothetical protein
LKKTKFALAVATLTVVLAAALIVTIPSFISPDSNSPPQFQLGIPRINNQTFLFNGQQLKIVSYEEFPITVRSQDVTNISLTALDIPNGVWVKFMPSILPNVDSKGTGAEMILAGAVKPLTPGTRNTSIIIQTTNSKNVSSLVDFPIIQTQNLTIMDSPSIINLVAGLNPTTNSSAFTAYGVVYDSLKPALNESLNVKLSVIGLNSDSGVVPLPNWLKVSLPMSDFTLQINQPYYFSIGVTTQSAPAGSVEVVIRENIAWNTYYEYLNVTIFANGPSLNSTSAS